MMDKLLYWEDFTPGMAWTAQRPRPVGREEIIQFATEYDPLDIHVDPDRARLSPIGVHCASGVHTLGMAQRLLCDAFLLKTHVVAGGRIDGLVMLNPVLGGDVLQLSAEVVEAKPHSRKEDRGWTIFKVELATAEQRAVLVYETSLLILRRCRDEPQKSAWPAAHTAPG